MILKVETSMHLSSGTATLPQCPAGETCESSDRVDVQYLSIMLVPVQHMVYDSAAEADRDSLKLPVSRRTVVLYLKFPVFFVAIQHQYHRFKLETPTFYEFYPQNLCLKGYGVNADKYGI